MIAQRPKPEGMPDEDGGDLTETGDAAWRTAQTADSGDLLMVLRQLPLDQQRAIILKFGRGHSSREIGTALNLSEGAAKQLIHRALVALYAALESE
jgi:DNA-directed RNA polymerase specialized sigma24 family protein